MYGAYSVRSIREAEARAMIHIGEGALMQRAAAGLAQVVLGELHDLRGRAYGSRVLVVVGPGNNGGDGLYAAVRLARRGVDVRAWRTAQVVHDAGWAAFLAAGGREVDASGALAELGRADLVIDAVIGIGGRGGLAGPVALLAQECRATGVPVVAVDLPSGLAPEPVAGWGVVGGASGASVSTPARSASSRGPSAGPVTPSRGRFTADVTVTFGGHKLCHVMQPARAECGRIEYVDLGLVLAGPVARCWEPSDVARVWPVPAVTADKYARGVVGVDAGSRQFPGAGVLATTGAVHAGAGMVRYTGDSHVAPFIHQALPNVVVGEGRVQARVLGSGWGDREDGRRVVADAIAEGLPLVLDADALRMLPSHGSHPGVLLTPHAGELARLLGCERFEVEADPLGALAEAVRLTGATVLLKGATQYVAAPGRPEVDIAVPGPAWTAQAGSGDVLAGICGTLLAAGLSTVEAAAAAAGIQALAARRLGPVAPQDLAQQLPRIIQSIYP